MTLHVQRWVDHSPPLLDLLSQFPHVRLRNLDLLWSVVLVLLARQFARVNTIPTLRKHFGFSLQRLLSHLSANLTHPSPTTDVVGNRRSRASFDDAVGILDDMVASFAVLDHTREGGLMKVLHKVAVVGSGEEGASRVVGTL